MRIAFFVNSIEEEFPHYTTTVLAFAALSRGHEICYVTPGDFVLRPDDTLMVRALQLPSSAYKKLETLHKDLQGDKTKVTTIDIREIDIIFLRNDPSQDAAERLGQPMSARCSVASPSSAACWSSTIQAV
jgi:glutathione synthase